jgi:hypothetical protein
MGQIYQRGRIGFMLVASCSVLGVATSASAECAWVLWSMLSATGREMRMAPVVAFQSLPQCEAREAEMSKAVRMSETGKELYRELGITSHTYTCLPDTIDPRGPKGGK